MTFVTEPEVPEASYTSGVTKLHDAGYDSYLTSSVFINLCGLYGKFSLSIQFTWLKTHPPAKMLIYRLCMTLIY